jgi:putative flippase GtrA
MERARSDVGRRAIKYSATSVVGVVITQVLLIVFHSGLHWSPGWSNVWAVVIASGPAYYLNRAWVWGKRGGHHLTKEILPFWGFSLAGLLVSTLLVTFATNVWHSQLAVNGANIVGFGVLWVVKYLVLDQLMFGVGHHSAVEAELDAA